MVDLEFHPLAPGRWDDLVALFGERGTYCGCWCMWWRLTSREFGAGNREAAASLFTGTTAMFHQAGFEEVARRSPARPIMRIRLA
jgi:hypothetical protein